MLLCYVYVYVYVCVYPTLIGTLFSDKAMDDELRLIIETAVPFAIPATIQLMIFVYVTNIAKDIRKWGTTLACSFDKYFIEPPVPSGQSRWRRSSA